MSSLCHLIYASAATVDLNDEALTALLHKARNTNSQLGVTGMLLYGGGDFIQVLEGEQAVVDNLYRRIAGDKRHEHVTRITRESIAARSFSEWTLGFAHPAPQELAEMNGRDDFFGDALCFRELDDGRAKRLLAAFAEGQWRARVSAEAGRQQRADRRALLPLK